MIYHIRFVRQFIFILFFLFRTNLYKGSSSSDFTINLFYSFIRHVVILGGLVLGKPDGWRKALVNSSQLFDMSALLFLFTSFKYLPLSFGLVLLFVIFSSYFHFLLE
jgi:hypothetical protein